MAWQSGGSPLVGVTTDAQGNMTVAGDVISSSALGGTFHQFKILNPNLAAPLAARISGFGEVFCAAVFIICTDEAGPETAFSVSQPSTWNLPVATFGVSGDTQRVKIGREGGIGVFAHDPQTVPRALAQAVITAITDANAKTAVQALANTLADMGALTIT